MRALSLWQPWASLLVDGIKEYETRSYPMPDQFVGRRMACHAGLQPVIPEAINDRLREIARGAYGSGWERSLPRGGIIGTFVPASSSPSDSRPPGETRGRAELMDEFAMGDWSPGRWVYRITRPIPLDRVLPMRGCQRWWTVDGEELRRLSGR